MPSPPPARTVANSSSDAGVQTLSVSAAQLLAITAALAALGLRLELNERTHTICLVLESAAPGSSRATAIDIDIDSESESDCFVIDADSQPHRASDHLTLLPRAPLVNICQFLPLICKVRSILRVSKHFYRALDADCFRGDEWIFRALPPSELLPHLTTASPSLPTILERFSGVSSFVIPMRLPSYLIPKRQPGVPCGLRMLLEAPGAPLRRLEVQYASDENADTAHCLTLLRSNVTGCANLTSLVVVTSAEDPRSLVHLNFADIALKHLHTFRLDISGLRAESISSTQEFLIRHPTVTDLTVAYGIHVEDWQSRNFLPALKRIKMQEVAAGATVQAMTGTVMALTGKVRPLERVTAGGITDSDSARQLFKTMTLRSLTLGVSAQHWNTAINRLTGNYWTNVVELQLTVSVNEESIMNVTSLCNSLGAHGGRVRLLRLVFGGEFLIKKDKPQPRFNGLESMHQLRVLDFGRVCLYCDPTRWSRLRALSIRLLYSDCADRTALVPFFQRLPATLTDLTVDAQCSVADATCSLNLLMAIGQYCQNLEYLKIYFARVLMPETGDRWNIATKRSTTLAATLTFTKLHTLMIESGALWTQRSTKLSGRELASLLSWFASSPLQYVALPSTFSYDMDALVVLSHFASLRGFVPNRTTFYLEQLELPYAANETQCTRDWNELLLSDQKVQPLQRVLCHPRWRSTSGLIHVFRTDNVDGHTEYFSQCFRQCPLPEQAISTLESLGPSASLQRMKDWRQALRCVVCDKRASELRCSGCERAWYCSADHLRKHWSEHRNQCRSAPPMCFCGQLKVLLTSHTRENPNRKFWTCPKERNQQCPHSFAWQS